MAWSTFQHGMPKNEKKSQTLKVDGYSRNCRPNVEFLPVVDFSGLRDPSNITPSPYPYKYIELLKPCPLAFGTAVCGIMRGKYFEAEGEKQISPA